MNKSYLYSLFIALLLISSAYSECNLESGECGEQAVSPLSYKSVRADYVSGYGCVASINISMIPGTGRIIVVDGTNRPAADYSVTVRNLGSCVIYGADVQITVPSGGFIYTTNNLQSTGTEGSYSLIINVGTINSIAPGGVYTNASLTAYFLSSGVAPGFDTSIVAKCESTCLAPVTTSTVCRAETSVTIRGSATQSSNGKYTAQYDVLIINLGTCGIYEVGLDFSLPPGVTITSATGLVQTYGVGQYKATGFRNNRVRFMQGDTLASEDRYVASLTAEFDTSDEVLQKFTVDSTSFCASYCTDPLATPAPSNTQCAAIVTAAWISTSPRVVLVDGVNRNAVDYEVFVANYGSCSISSVSVTFNPYSGSYISSVTNLQATGTTNQYTISTALTTPGATYNGATITVVFASSGYAYQTPVSAVSPQCNGCDRVTDTPSTSSPTPSPTSTPTPSQGCSVSATAVLRTSWKSGSTENRLYDFIISNTGSSVAKTADISLAFSTASEVTQSWNVEKISSSVYRANLYSAAPNTVVRSSGYVLTIDDAVYSSGFTDPVVSVASTQCF